MSDQVRLAGMAFYGYHGVADEERRLGQRFVVAVDLYLDLAPAGTSDDLSQTVDYGAVYQQVRQVVEGPPCRLLETVAERVAAALLAAHRRLERVAVTVEKPAAPIAGAATVVASVRLVRGRG